MRTMVLALGILAIVSLSGCATTGMIAVAPAENSSFSYWTGTHYVWVDPDDYYYQSGGIIYRHHHSVDVVINYIPPVTVYIHPRRIDISDYNHSRSRMNNQQLDQHRRQDMNRPRGGYGQPSIQNPNHRINRRQEGPPRQMQSPVHRQIQPQQQRRQMQAPPAVRQVPPRVIQQRPQSQPRVAPPTRQAPSRVMQQQRRAPQRVAPQPRPSRPLHSIPQGNRGTRKR